LDKLGQEIIRDFANKLDNSPGVYRMLDNQARVLYVGKARRLKARVLNYARHSGHSSRIARMISETVDMMVLTTETETEALLLEQNLIKQLKPKYNVLLRDDKSFPYIFISNEHDFPRIEKHRGAKLKKGFYYGPFASAGAVNRTINTLQKIFLLRSCSDREVEAGDRPCLNYHIKRCAGPCGGKVTKEDYAELVKSADDFLKGRSTEIQEMLAAKMEKASVEMEFEKAAGLRDRIRALTNIQSSQGINPKSIRDADVIGLHRDGAHACIQVFFIRAYQNWGNKDFYPRINLDNSDEEVQEAFVGQFYSNKEPPKQVILSHPVENHDLIISYLTEKLGKKVEIIIPRRGEKFDIVSSAIRNARESLGRKLEQAATQKNLLNSLAVSLNLNSIPNRIEIYDNSHIQGSDAVGAMVVAGPEGMEKNEYRKFNIKNDKLIPGDDVGMMKEVITRRFRRLIVEDPDRSLGKWPDLILIDGGAGQISAVSESMQSIGISEIPLVGVAKGMDRDQGKEEFYKPGEPKFALKRNDPVLYFIQRMRDEAHRFAIGAHRAKRAKQVIANPLDGISGIGSKRKKALLSHFGSGKAVKRASLADLKVVDGISKAMAEKIYGYFNEKH
jgi:excinuclease ABC subunit C